MAGLLSFKRGQAAEYLVAAAALARGMSVLFNLDPYDKWDLQINGQRYQVKLAYKRSDRKRGGDYVDIMRTTSWKHYHIKDADFLAVVDFKTLQVHVFPWPYVYDKGRITMARLMQEVYQTWTIQ